MSNCEVFKLPDLELELHQVREVLRCILHTILFNRALNLVEPVDVDLELFDLTYVKCNDAVLETHVESKISEIIKSMSQKSTDRRAQLSLSFYEIKSKPGSLFGKAAERMHWEQWLVHIAVLEDAPPEMMAPSARTVGRRDKMQAAVQACLTEVLRLVNSKRDHIPPVPRAGTEASPGCSPDRRSSIGAAAEAGQCVPFPFEIVLMGVQHQFLGMVKNLLMKTSNASTPSVLN